jgi:hypothetical protein
METKNERYRVREREIEGEREGVSYCDIFPQWAMERKKREIERQGARKRERGIEVERVSERGRLVACMRAARENAIYYLSGRWRARDREIESEIGVAQQQRERREKEMKGGNRTKRERLKVT